MKKRIAAVVFCCFASVHGSRALAQDWPQWRGPERDARATGFQVPSAWPKELSQKWKVEVGDGVATPALVGDRLFVFSRQGGDEVLRCLEADSGKEVWIDKYPAESISGPAAGFPGPRSSPAVADGKIVTLGVQGVLSCLDAATGKVVWRNREYEGAIPRFATASSPLLVDDLCFAQLGDDRGGAVVALNLADGKEKWKWAGDGPAYASPVVVKLDQTTAVIAVSSQKLVALRADDGKLLWENEYAQGRYNATTPVFDGSVMVVAGPNRGISAEKLSAKDAAVESEPLWSNTDNSVQFNSPVIKDGWAYGLSNMNSLFCVNLADGKTAWSAPLDAAAGQGDAGRAGGRGERPGRGDRAGGAGQDGGGRGRGGPGGRRGRGGGGGGGYGSIVDLGSVLLALTPASKLVVFLPSSEGFTELASYKVADGQTYAYPIATGTSLFIKDTDSVTRWSLE